MWTDTLDWSAGTFHRRGAVVLSAAEVDGDRVRAHARGRDADAQLRRAGIVAIAGAEVNLRDKVCRPRADGHGLHELCPLDDPVKSTNRCPCCGGTSPNMLMRTKLPFDCTHGAKVPASKPLLAM
jgi:hypothetical protein